jgi:hypothetical protein
LSDQITVTFRRREARALKAALGYLGSLASTSLRAALGDDPRDRSALFRAQSRISTAVEVDAEQQRKQKGGGR